MPSSVRTAQVPSSPNFIAEIIESLTVKGRAILRGAGKTTPEPADLEQIASVLLSRRGEASGVALATALLKAYEETGPAGRVAFLEALRDRFGPDPDETAKVMRRLASDQTPAAISAFHVATEPRRQELFRRLNLAPGGTAALVAMREDLLRFLPQRPDLAPVDADMLHLLSSWFNRGFLVLRPIDWSTPASILEKIIRYEAVHEIGGWDDLRNRLKPADRRCYGFFHPQLTDEPIIFVEVALTKSVPSTIVEVLDTNREPIRPEDAQHAVFYSISNTQSGLRGVNFGNFLIKQVVENLRAELANLKGFVTLSPVPGFATWLSARRKEGATPEKQPDPLCALDTPQWFESSEGCETVRPALMRAAAEYLLQAKDEVGRPLDPVSRFHLGNGAALHRLCFLGDTSPKGMRQSHGIMVNYRYDVREIEKNHEAFAEHGVIAAAPDVSALLRGSDATRKQRS